MIMSLKQLLYIEPEYWPPLAYYKDQVYTDMLTLTSQIISDWSDNTAQSRKDRYVNYKVIRVPDPRLTDEELHILKQAVTERAPHRHIREITTLGRMSEHSNSLSAMFSQTNGIMIRVPDDMLKQFTPYHYYTLNSILTNEQYYSLWNDTKKETSHGETL